ARLISAHTNSPIEMPALLRLRHAVRRRDDLNLPSVVGLGEGCRGRLAAALCGKRRKCRLDLCSIDPVRRSETVVKVHGVLRRAAGVRGDLVDRAHLGMTEAE